MQPSYLAARRTKRDIESDDEDDGTSTCVGSEEECHIFDAIFLPKISQMEYAPIVNCDVVELSHISSHNKYIFFIAQAQCPNEPSDKSKFKRTRNLAGAPNSKKSVDSRKPKKIGTNDVHSILKFSVDDLSFGESSSGSDYQTFKLKFNSLIFLCLFPDQDCSTSSIHLSGKSDMDCVGHQTHQSENSKTDDNNSADNTESRLYPNVHSVVLQCKKPCTQIK